jgi:hypothetical protein
MCNRGKVGTIDYRCEDRMAIGKLGGGIGDKVIAPSFRTHHLSPPRKKPLTQEVHLKILLLKQGF